MPDKATWIVVTDGGHARIARSEGVGPKLRIAPEYVKQLDADVPAGRDIVTDRPGRTFDSAGTGRHAMAPPSDPREHAKQEFIRSVAQCLEEANSAGKFQRLILVAPPRALGELRSRLSNGLQAKVAHELPKDLTSLSPGELGEHLAKALDLP